MKRWTSATGSAWGGWLPARTELQKTNVEASIRSGVLPKVKDRRRTLVLPPQDLKTIMHFSSDDQVKAYVNSQLAKVRATPNGPFYAFIRPQWRYRNLPSNEMDIGHLEWKIYRKTDLGRLGGDVPSSTMIDEVGSMFGYWVLRITSDYRCFIFVHGNSHCSALEFYDDLDRGSILEVSRVTEDGERALSHYMEYVLTNFPENRYYFS